MKNKINSFSQLCCSGTKAFMLMAAMFMAQSASAEICWKDSYGRGVGTIPNVCPAGFKATLVGTCLSVCPPGYRDDGLFCRKAEYGRGAGYALWDANKCNRENPATGCEKCLLMYYPKCAPGFKPVGCNICAAAAPVCPAGWTEFAGSCTKKSITADCAADAIKDAGLCYKGCSDTYKGVGPVCWGQCPAGLTDCGAMCGASLSECGKAVFDSIVAGVKAVKNIYDMVAGDGKTEEGKADPKKLKDAIATTPGAAKKIAESISKAMKEGKISNLSEIPKLGKEQYDKLLAGIGGQDNLNKLIAAAKNPSDIDGLTEVVKGLDPTGLANFASTFKRPICGK